MPDAAAITRIVFAIEHASKRFGTVLAVLPAIHAGRLMLSRTACAGG